MRYWAYLVAKLAVAGGVFTAAWELFHTKMPPSQQFDYVDLEPFAHDLWYTAAVMVFWLVAVGVVYLIALDQRYRCRTCLRRLRMPVTRGTWNHFLLGAPRTEYICLYGHGTLHVPEVHIAGEGGSDWKPIDDMWRELEELGTTRK